MTKVTLYQVYDGRRFSWKGFMYYIKHKKMLTEETISRALTTRNDKGFSSSSIFRTIANVLNGTYHVKRGEEELKNITPLTKLQKGDIIWCLSFMACRYWQYDGERIIFIEER